MANDDFLKEFQAEPPAEFGESLLAKLRQMDAEEQKTSPVTEKAPLIVLPAPRRSRERHLSWIASLALLFFFSSILLFSVKKETPPDNGNSIAVEQLSGLSQLAWSPDGRLLYVSDESHLYRLNLRLQLVDAWPLSLNGSVTSMIFAGNYLLLGDTSGSLSLWDSATMQMLETVSVHDGALELIRYLPNKRIILSSGADGDLVSLRLSGTHIEEISRLALGDGIEIRGLAVQPNEEAMIATSSNAVSLVYNLDNNGRLLANSTYALSSFPPTAQADYIFNGQFLTLVWWDTLRVVDSQTLSERYHYRLPEPFLWLSPLQSAANRVLLSNPNGVLGVWDFNSEQYLEIYRTTGNHPLQAALHPDGQLIAAISAPNEVRLWQLEQLSDSSISRREVAVNRPSSNQPSENRALTLAPLSEDLSQLRELYHFGDGYLLETRWSPDGSLLMVSSTSTIRLYNANLNFLREWSVLGMTLSTSAFSPDGRYLLTGSQTGDLAIWDVLTGQNISTMQVQERAIVFLAFLNGGSRVLSRNEAGEFVLLNFDGRQLTLRSRSEQAALANWTIQDWQADGDTLHLLMARRSPNEFSTSDLLNLIEMSLGDTISAEASSTGINGNLARFVSQDRILVYEQRDQSLQLYARADMRWLDSFPLPVSIATLNDIAYDPVHEQLLLVDFDRSLSLFSLDFGVLRSINNTAALFENPAHTVALHPSGLKTAVITSHNRVALWQFDEENNEVVLEEIANDNPVLGQMRSFVLSSNNIAAASTSEGAVLLFDGLTGNLLRRLDLQSWGVVNHELLFSPDGTILAFLGQDRAGRESRLHLINVEAALSGADDYMIGDSPFIFTNEYLSGMAFNRMGDSFYTGGTVLRHWSIIADTVSWTNASEIRGLSILAHNPRLGKLASLRSGNYLMVLQTDNMENRYLTRLYGRSMPVNTFLEYSADGHWLLLVVEGEAPKIFDASTEDTLLSLDSLEEQHFNALALSDNDLYLAGHQGILVVNLAEAIANPENFNYQTLPYRASQLAISANKQRLFYLADDGMVRVLGLPEN